MILEHFNERTLANMEVALERACERLPRHMNSHEIRKRIAAKILESAGAGENSLKAFTAAGITAANAVTQTQIGSGSPADSSRRPAA